jgi:hypothetical protein
MSPAMGISIGLKTGSVSSSTTYVLDRSASLQEEAVLDESKIFQTREAHGSGNNLIAQSVSSDKYSADNIIDSKGTFDVSASIGASESSVGISQSLGGSGDLRAALQATAGSDISGQQAEVASGALSTSQSLVAGEGAYTGQKTDLRGDAGAIASVSSSAENEMTLSGGFSGEGNLNADLSSVAYEQSAVGGDASLLGVSLVDEEDLNDVASGEIAMSVDGLYALPKGDLGTFGMSISNAKKGAIGVDTSSALLAAPVVTSDGGRSSAYALTGKRWNQKDPQIKLYLRTDANLAGEAMSTTAVQSAIANAANTWDDATNQNLFADANLVTTTTSANAGTYDGKNTIAWKTLSCSYLGYAQTWYRLNKVDGYYPILESDITCNGRYPYNTNGASSGIDVQTLVTHELGHTIGLGDIYNNPAFSKDTRQVMHYYTGLKRTLGNGDKTGVWALYN